MERNLDNGELIMICNISILCNIDMDGKFYEIEWVAAVILKLVGR